MFLFPTSLEYFYIISPIPTTEKNLLPTFSKSGGGFFPLHRLLIHHTTFLTIVTLDGGALSISNRGSIMPRFITMSLYAGLSPAILPETKVIS